jgi:hypothetical protein
MQIAEGTSLYEPELFYLPFLRSGTARRPEPVSHALPIRRMHRLATRLAAGVSQRALGLTLNTQTGC